MSGLSVISDGYELRKTEDNKSEYFEVMPNEMKLTSSVTDLFGYDPYYQYQTLSFNNFEKIKLNDVKHEKLQQEVYKLSNKTLQGYQSKSKFDIILYNIKFTFKIR